MKKQKTPEEIARIYNSDWKSEDIGVNRVVFVKKFGIEHRESGNTVCDLLRELRDRGPLPFQMRQPPLDHLEKYRTRTGGVVLVASQYEGLISKDAAAIGFRRYDVQLYHSKATTFVAFFKNLRAITSAKNGLRYLHGERKIKSPDGTLGIFLEEAM